MLLRELIEIQDIIIAPGAYDVVSAQIIEMAGFPIAYLTGLGNEASDLGCPDLGLATSTELIRRAGNVVRSVSVPVVCDADTGFGGALNIHRTVRMFESALPLFAAMKALTKVVAMLKDSGTIRQMSEELVTYEEYEEVVKLSRWLNIDEKYGQ